MTVLILGGADDEHAVYMLQHLRSRGHDAELFDSRNFPARLTIAYDPVRGAGQLRLRGGRALNLAQVRSVYWRTYNGVGAPNCRTRNRQHWRPTMRAAFSSRC